MTIRYDAPLSGQYRWLATLLKTAEKFALNAVLPIPFDERGRMEVDLLCACLDNGFYASQVTGFRNSCQFFFRRPVR